MSWPDSRKGFRPGKNCPPEAVPNSLVYRIKPDLTVELAYTISSNQMAGTPFDQFALPAYASRVLFWG